MKASDALRMSNPEYKNGKDEIEVVEFIHSSIIESIENHEPLERITIYMSFDDSFLQSEINDLLSQGFNIIYYEDYHNQIIIYWGKYLENGKKGKLIRHNRNDLPYSSYKLKLEGFDIKFDYSKLSEAEIYYINDLINSMDNNNDNELSYNSMFLDDFIDVLITFKGYKYDIDYEKKICIIKP